MDWGHSGPLRRAAFEKPLEEPTVPCVPGQERSGVPDGEELKWN